jgi:Type II secretion system (T2SS), protein E, N-terminal domain
VSAAHGNGHGGLAEGVVPPSTVGGRAGLLSDVLIELGFADRESVEHAVRAARSPGTTVARALVEMGVISEEELARAIAERHGVAYVDLDRYPVDPAAVNLIQPEAAMRYRAVPVGFTGAALLVAMADPADAIGVNDVAHLSKRDVQPAAAARPALEALLERLPLHEQHEANAAADGVLDEPGEGESGAEDAAGKTERLGEKLAQARRRLEEAESRAAELGDRLAATRGELDQARAEADGARALGAELERTRAETETVCQELNAVTAERDELREESERERERAAQTELELRSELAAEEERRRHVEERVRELETAASAAERALEELRLVLSDASPAGS